MFEVTERSAITLHLLNQQGGIAQKGRPWQDRPHNK